MIGELNYKCPLWLVRLTTLVFVLRHLTENCSISKLLLIGDVEYSVLNSHSTSFNGRGEKPRFFFLWPNFNRFCRCMLPSYKDFASTWKAHAVLYIQQQQYFSHENIVFKMVLIFKYGYSIYIHYGLVGKSHLNQSVYCIQVFEIVICHFQDNELLF